VQGNAKKRLLKLGQSGVLDSVSKSYKNPNPLPKLQTAYLRRKFWTLVYGNPKLNEIRFRMDRGTKFGSRFDRHEIWWREKQKAKAKIELTQMLQQIKNTRPSFKDWQPIIWVSKKNCKCLDV
jgi:hypothetical protein